MAINRTAIRDLLLPGLADITGKYPQIPARYREFMAVKQSKMAQERIAEMRYTGLAQLKAEGGQTVFDNAAGERFVYNILMQSIGLGFAITRETMADNQYKEAFNPKTLGLMESFAQTKDILAADYLNTGNVVRPQVGGDGKALFATDHVIDNGTYANRPATDLDFSESSVEYALNAVRTFPDQAGMLAMVRGKKLVVPLALQWAAERLFNTEKRVGTGNNDTNAIRSMGALPDGFVVNEFLTSQFAWFLLTSVDGLVLYEREAFETDIQVDQTTGNLLVVGYERYGIGHTNPRCGWASYPTA